MIIEEKSSLTNSALPFAIRQKRKLLKLSMKMKNI